MPLEDNKRLLFSRDAGQKAFRGLAARELEELRSGDALRGVRLSNRCMAFMRLVGIPKLIKAEYNRIQGIHR